MSLLNRIKRALRGDVRPQTVVLESIRRGQTSFQRGRDRVRLERLNTEPARLLSEFARLQPTALLDHFRQRTQPLFFAGFKAPADEMAAAQRRLFPEETVELLARAERITQDHCWPILGLGDKCFGSPVEWHRDPLTGFNWPLDYYADISLMRGDGSDVRFVWELNRSGHFITLARAYLVTGDERFSNEFFNQLESWHSSNPLGRGVNWNCAMEVALRAMNLLGAFTVFRRAPEFDEERLARLLKIFDHHGKFIREHLEFSYIATSNHYLSDVIGLLWLGILLPELGDAEDWRAFALREMLREMDKQVLEDGSDFESSTGYHRFVLELFAYSFVLCRQNEIEIESRYWNKLRQMFKYLLAYLRPDGYAPLIGDSDSGQVFPICRRTGNDHAYLLALGAVICDDPQLKNEELKAPPELLWLMGEQALEEFHEVRPDSSAHRSRSFPDAGIHVLRDKDLYLLFNASGAGINGRGSHGHNDALGIEVSAGGTAFLVDPGTYLYTGDLAERHMFRSTSYHSTVQVDEIEQNTTSKETPFVIGSEAEPDSANILSQDVIERVTSQHRGYERLPAPVTHRRTVTFNKQDRCWLIEDELSGSGEHRIQVRFHFNTGLAVSTDNENCVRALSETTNTLLFVCSLDSPQPPKLETQFTSRDYGQKSESVSACWELVTTVPATFRWVVIPSAAHENEEARLRLIRSAGELSFTRSGQNN